MLRFLSLFVTLFICSFASCQVSNDSCRVEGKLPPTALVEKITIGGENDYGIWQELYWRQHTEPTYPPAIKCDGRHFSVTLPMHNARLKGYLRFLSVTYADGEICSVPFFIEQGCVVRIEAKDSSKHDFIQSGSPLNEILCRYMGEASAITGISDAKYATMRPNWWWFVQFAASQTEASVNEINRLNLDYISKNKGNLFGIVLLQSYGPDPAGWLLLDKFVPTMPDDLVRHRGLKDHYERLKTARHCLDSLSVVPPVLTDTAKAKAQYYKDWSAVNIRYGYSAVNEETFGLQMLSAEMTPQYFIDGAKVDIRYIRDNITNPFGIRLLAKYGKPYNRTFAVWNYLIYRFYPQVPVKYADMPAVKELKAAYDRIVYMKKLTDAM